MSILILLSTNNTVQYTLNDHMQHCSILHNLSTDNTFTSRYTPQLSDQINTKLFNTFSYRNVNVVSVETDNVYMYVNNKWFT